jgi:endonuclease G
MGMLRSWVLFTSVLLGCSGGLAPKPEGTIRSAPRTAIPSTASPNVALGIPTDGDPSDDLIIDRGVFVASYNPRKNVPNWVSWRLDRRDLGSADRSDDFHADLELPLGVYRVTPADYEHSGYDRGHLCPSADRTSSPTLNRETFLMSNIHPQRPGLNRHTWERLEQHERELAKTKEVYVIAGGIFGTSPESIGHGVAVPSSEFKIIVVLDTLDAGAEAVSTGTPVIAVEMPNDDAVKEHSWTDYRTTIDAIERDTGYDFLSSVGDDVQRAIESR